MKQTLRYTLMLSACLLFFAGCTKETNNPPATPPIAVAGNFQTVQLPVNTVTMTGSGSTTNGKITGYLWSLVSGPNVPVINSPSATITTINGLVGGTYILQFAVIDNAGLTGVDTVSVLVKPAVQQTITLQPANNPNDIHTDSRDVGNGSGDTEIPIGAWTTGGIQENYRAFFKFDQSAVPANARIISATLYLYAMPNPHGGDVITAHFGTANAFYVERLTTSWTRASLTWNTQPASATGNIVTVPQSTAGFENAVVDVTGIVQDMQTAGNFGFRFRMLNETIYNFRQYASSYYSDAALHPKLVITYQ